MRIMINAVGITPDSTTKSGWISHSATMNKAHSRISQWSKEIIDGDYKNWPSSMRANWVDEMINKGYKIKFYIVLHDQGYEVDYNKEIA